ncbi:MAG: mechanosensitive ion channel [Eubacteriales bacterium]|nr:mechanosensitive ion channel [Eubacteriales bacterium]
MSKRLKRKAAVLVIAELICLIVLGVFLDNMQVSLSAREQAHELQKKISPLKEAVEEAKIEAGEHTKAYDVMYQSKAKSLAYMIQEEVDEEVTDTLMGEYRNLLNVNNVLILDKSGNVEAKAEASRADFTRSRYNQLRTVFQDQEPSEPFEVDVDGQIFRYYGADIDGNTMAVIEQDPAELKGLLEDTSTWKSILRNVSVSTTGYAFAVSAKDYTFLYHPDENLTGQDALDAGIHTEDLEDGNEAWVEINGEKLLCSVAKLDDAYVLCGIPEKEIKSSCNVTVAVVLCVFFAVITLVVAYAIFIMKDQEMRQESIESSYKKVGPFWYNQLAAAKSTVIAVVGLLCVLAVSLYMQTLFSLSQRSMSNTQHVEELQATIQRYEEDVNLLKEQYNTRYLNKCRCAAYILKEKPELRNREDLAKLSQVLDVEFINYFDSTGTIVATNSFDLGFKLSQDEEDQSYEFNRLLAGAEYLVQDARPNDVLGEYSQYVGVRILDEEGLPDGFVQICVNPENLEEALKNLKIDSILDGVQVGSNGFAFALNKEDNTFAWYPNEKYIGGAAVDYGIKESQIHDGFTDYLTIGTERYYASCLETEDYYIYACVPENEIASNGLVMALISTGVSLVFLLIMGALISFRGRKFAEEDKDKDKQDGGMITVTMPDGNVKRTQDVSSRWSNATLAWEEKTPEQKMTTLLKGLLSIYAVILCAVYLLNDRIFGSKSMFAYIISGNWEKGLNIFAFTGCIFIICLVTAVTILIQRILRLLSRISGAQGETISRLLSNFVKYASVIILLYYCLALLGVDTAALLTSAGIIGLMISLGAQKLVSDIIAGLFIIFEGEFRVGDIVMLGDWRGTVVEIGIRTTKIEEAGGNIKVVNNSSISGVINMTKKYSFAACDFGIEYGESLERVEYILKKELPRIKERVPSILDGPFYKGVTELGDSSVNIKIVAQCKEKDRIQLMRDLNREVKLIFDKYEINIPFPQVVLNQPSEFRKATEWQKQCADKFNEEQKELSKQLEEEQ